MGAKKCQGAKMHIAADEGIEVISLELGTIRQTNSRQDRDG